MQATELGPSRHSNQLKGPMVPATSANCNLVVKFLSSPNRKNCLDLRKGQVHNDGFQVLKWTWSFSWQVVLEENVLRCRSMSQLQGCQSEGWYLFSFDPVCETLCNHYIWLTYIIWVANLMIESGLGRWGALLPATHNSADDFWGLPCYILASENWGD